MCPYTGVRVQGSGVRGQGSGEGNVEKLSRFRSLAESHGFSRDVLSNDEEVSEKRNLWTFKSAPPLAAEATSLIKKETSKFRVYNAKYGCLFEWLFNAEYFF